MRRRPDANTWVLGALAIVLIGAMADAGARLLSGPLAATQQRADGRFAPGFRVGDRAPDFTLPDRTGTPHRLSAVVRRETLLCFTCACANCIDLQTYLGILIEKMGTRAPDVVSVTTMPKEREETYVRDTGLRQRFLYEPKEGPVMAQYRGHPCPRVYHLKADRTVTWIGSSPGSVPTMRTLGNEMAAHLGFPGPVGLDSGGPPPAAAPARP